MYINVRQNGSAEIDCDVIGQRSALPRLLHLAHYAVSFDMTPYLLTVHHITV